MKKISILAVLLPLLLVNLAMATAEPATDALFVFEGNGRLSYFDQTSTAPNFLVTEGRPLTIAIMGWDVQKATDNDILFSGFLGEVGWEAILGWADFGGGSFAPFTGTFNVKTQVFHLTTYEGEVEGVLTPGALCTGIMNLSKKPAEMTVHFQLPKNGTTGTFRLEQVDTPPPAQ